MDRVKALFRASSGAGGPLGNAPSLAPSLDPFCKTSFDALLESLNECAPDSLMFTDENNNVASSTFPGFDPAAQVAQLQQQHISQLSDARVQVRPQNACYVPIHAIFILLTFIYLSRATHSILLLAGKLAPVLCPRRVPCHFLPSSLGMSLGTHRG